MISSQHGSQTAFQNILASQDCVGTRKIEIVSTDRDISCVASVMALILSIMAECSMICFTALVDTPASGARIYLLYEPTRGARCARRWSIAWLFSASALRPMPRNAQPHSAI
jgi:hypothetical protein